MKRYILIAATLCMFPVTSHAARFQKPSAETMRKVAARAVTTYVLGMNALKAVDHERLRGTKIGDKLANGIARAKKVDIAIQELVSR